MSIPEEPDEEDRYEENRYEESDSEENRDFSRHRSPQYETDSDSENVSKNYDEEYGIDRVPERRLYDSE